MTVAERFFAKCRRGGTDECWPWLARRDRDGYGRFRCEGRMALAHRVAYGLLIGPPPPELDHTCRRRDCVNPWHLEPVTHAQNMRRGAHARKTHCLRGHPYDETNTRWVTPTKRACRACDRERCARRRAAA